jgi:hypothetical protein
MFTQVPNTSAALARALLIHYSFDLSGYSASELVNIWQKQFASDWLHLAVVEALYQGRYKAISVQQILIFWHRRGQATFHFNMEFERLICSKFPESLTLQSPNLPLVTKNNSNQEQTTSESLAKLPPVSLPSTTVIREDNGASNRQTKVRESRSSYTVGENQQQADNSVKPFLSSKTTPSYTISTSSPTASQRLPLPSSSSSQIPYQPTNLFPPTTNPPIGQFTPETTKRSESFTSKLKAMSHDQQHGNSVQNEPESE